VVTDATCTLEAGFNYAHGPAWQLSFELSCAAEIVVLFGPSGSGKSTVLNCLAGLLRPARGKIVANQIVFFDSANGINLAPQKRRVGYVFQNYALFPHLNVRQNILFGIDNLPRATQEEKLEQLLSLFHLEGLGERRHSQLSGGQMQRVAIARALATNPKLLLLDEPFSALDPVLRTELAQELKRLQSKLAIPVVFVTHSPSEASVLADRIIVMDESGQSRLGEVGNLPTGGD